MEIYSKDAAMSSIFTECLRTSTLLRLTKTSMSVEMFQLPCASFDKKCIRKKERAVVQLMKAAVPAESYIIHLSSASLVSCDVYGQ